MKIVYFGYDLFYTCFEEILSNPEIEVMALYTFPTDNVVDFNEKVIAAAKRQNIPVYIGKVRAEDLERLWQNGCRLVISAGYAYKIPILERPDFRGINVHPALLPVGRGPWPMPQVILKGLKTSGVTVHKLSRGFDEGDILLQDHFPVSEDETLRTLTDKITTCARGLIADCLSRLDVLWQNAVPQIGGEYWPEPDDKDRTICKTMTVKTADRIVRAFGDFGVLYEGQCYQNRSRQGVNVKLSDGSITLYK